MNDYIVYMHTCPNGKKYIGITCQTATRRWGGGANYKNCTFFYKAILKYGWRNMLHEILYENLSEIEAKQIEIYLISLYCTNDSKYGYNVTQGGDGTRGVRLSDQRKKEIGDFFRGKQLSEEHKRKMSLARSGDNSLVRGRTGAKCKLSKKVLQINKDTNEIIKIWDAVRDVERATGLSSASICRICNGARGLHTCGGYVWKYED